MENGLQRGVGSVVGEVGRSGQLAQTQTNTDLFKFANASSQLTKAIGNKIADKAVEENLELKKIQKDAFVNELKFNLIKTSNAYAEKREVDNSIDVAQMDFDTEEAMRYIDETNVLEEHEKEKLKLEHRGYRENVKSELVQKDIRYQKQVTEVKLLTIMDDMISSAKHNAFSSGFSLQNIDFVGMQKNLYDLQKLYPLKYTDALIRETMVSSVAGIIGNSLNKQLDELTYKSETGTLTPEEFEATRTELLEDYWNSSGAIKDYFMAQDIYDEPTIDKLQTMIRKTVSEVSNGMKQQKLKEEYIDRYTADSNQLKFQNAALDVADGENERVKVVRDGNGKVIAGALISNGDLYDRISKGIAGFNYKTGFKFTELSFSDRATTEEKDMIFMEWFYKNGIQNLYEGKKKESWLAATAGMTYQEKTAYLMEHADYGVNGENLDAVQEVEFAEANILPVHSDVFNKKERTFSEKNYVAYAEEILGSVYSDKSKRHVTITLDRLKKTRGWIEFEKATNNSTLSKNIFNFQTLSNNSQNIIDKKRYNAMKNSVEEYANVLLNERISKMPTAEKFSEAIAKSKKDGDEGLYGILTDADMKKLSDYSSSLLQINAERKNSELKEINGVKFHSPRREENGNNSDEVTAPMLANTVAKVKGLVYGFDTDKRNVYEMRDKALISRSIYVVDTSDPNFKFLEITNGEEKGRVSYKDKDGEMRDVLYNTGTQKLYTVIDGKAVEVDAEQLEDTTSEKVFNKLKLEKNENKSSTKPKEEPYAFLKESDVFGGKPKEEKVVAQSEFFKKNSAVKIGGTKETEAVEEPIEVASKDKTYITYKGEEHEVLESKGKKYILVNGGLVETKKLPAE